MRTRRSSLLAALLLVLACSKKSEPAPQPAAPAAPAQPAAPFTLRDLAAATALDARLARFSLVAADLQAALPAQVAAPAKGAAASPEDRRERARRLLPQLESAYAEAEHAAAAIGHPGDRADATPVVAAAKVLSGKLAAAATGDAAAVAPELFSARDALGAAIGQYRAARSRWRLDAPEPQGIEREFAEARREAERVEAGFGARTRVAPREEGHEFDPAAARMTGLMAAQRAQAAAERLPNPLRGPAVQYAVAQEQALVAVTALAQAPEAERAALSRRYHAAKADALAALADYFAALSTR